MNPDIDQVLADATAVMATRHRAMAAVDLDKAITKAVGYYLASDGDWETFTTMVTLAVEDCFHPFMDDPGSIPGGGGC